MVIKDWEEGGDGDESNSMKEPFEAFISGRDPWGNILTTCILPHSSFCEGIGSGVTFKILFNPQTVASQIQGDYYILLNGR